MPAAHRRTDTSLIGDLLETPQRFQFFQAVRLLVAWLGQHGVAPEQALLSYLRFDNSVSMRFPASQIEALMVETAMDGAAACRDNDGAGRNSNGHDGAGHIGGIVDNDTSNANTTSAISGSGVDIDDAEAALLQALLQRRLRHIRLTPTFMGLLGSHGVLPSHYSERIAAHQHGQRDDSARAFLDLFSGRALTQFYQAWDKYRIDHARPAGDDKFLGALLALVGRRPGSSAEHHHGPGANIGDDVIAYYGGLLQQRPMSAMAMQRILADYLGVPVALEESVGHMNRMRITEQTALGLANHRLGGGATLGPRLWRPDLRARLRIGPLDQAGFDHFLPGASGAATIHALLGLFGNALLDYEIVLILRGTQAGELRLDSTRPATRARLGFDTFLPAAAPRDRADMRYQITPMAPMAPNSARKK